MTCILDVEMAMKVNRSVFSTIGLLFTASSTLAFSTLATNIVRLVSTVVLTRLLSPDVYGITGIILSIFYAINMISDIGLQPYIIRHERSDEAKFLDSVFTIHAIRGVVLSIIAMLLAWPLAWIFAKPQLVAPLLVSSLVFAIDGQVSLHQFLGLRDGKVQRFAMIDLLTGISQTTAAIALALVFRNVWAIVASMLLASALRAWATYSLFPGGRHACRPDRQIAVDLWRFSRAVAASGVLTLVIGLADKLVLGRTLSLSQFGVYVVATSIAGAPAAFAFNYASSIVYPAVATAWRKGEPVSEAYYRCWGRFFYLYVFGGGILIGGADLIIRTLYDPRYLPAALYLSILATGTTLMMVTRSMETIEVAMGRPRIAIEMNVARLAWLTVGSVMALAKSEPLLFVIAIGLVELPAYAWAASRLARLGIIRWLREISIILPMVTGLAVGALASWSGRILLPGL